MLSGQCAEDPHPVIARSASDAAIQAHTPSPPEVYPSLRGEERRGEESSAGKSSPRAERSAGRSSPRAESPRRPPRGKPPAPHPVICEERKRRGNPGAYPVSARGLSIVARRGEESSVAQARAATARKAPAAPRAESAPLTPSFARSVSDAAIQAHTPSPPEVYPSSRGEERRGEESSAGKSSHRAESAPLTPSLRGA
jgi:hypothetical protein